MNESPSNVKKQSSGKEWMREYWRPLMAIQYMIVCLFDFMLAPIMMVLFAGLTSTPLVVWQSLTLQGGGLYHLAMGAVLGVAAWTRGQEKIATVGKE